MAINTAVGIGKTAVAKQNVPAPSVVKAQTAVPKANAVAAPTETLKPNIIGVPKPNKVMAPAETTPTYSNPAYQDWSTEQSNIFKQLQDKINTPFTYDPNTDAALQSQKGLYEAGAAKATQSALETMNDRGIMNSSLTSNQLGQIQQSANTQFNALIPQYQQQAYGQYQDSLANVGSLLNNAMSLRNNQFNEAVTEADLTGSYMPAGAQQLVDQIYALKGQAETKGINANDRNVLSQQADGLRKQLTAMGVNVDGIGANVNLANSTVGQRTLAGQNQDYNQAADTRNFAEDVRQYDTNLEEQIRQYDSNLDYTKIRDKVSDTQWTKQFDEQVRQFGMNNALDWAANSISQQNANVNSGQLSLSQAKFNYDKSQDATAAKGGSSSGGSSSTKIDSKSSTNLYSELMSDLPGMKNVEMATYILRRNENDLTDSDYRKFSEAISKRFQKEE